MRACRMQVSGQFVPSVIIFCQLAGAATAVGQLGTVATHERNQSISDGVDRDIAFPSPALRGGLGKMTGVGANDRKFAD